MFSRFRKCLGERQQCARTLASPNDTIEWSGNCWQIHTDQPSHIRNRWTEATFKNLILIYVTWTLSSYFAILFELLSFMFGYFGFRIFIFHCCLWTLFDTRFFFRLRSAFNKKMYSIFSLLLRHRREKKVNFGFFYFSLFFVNLIQKSS